jgi:hypothetical protein
VLAGGLRKKPDLSLERSGFGDIAAALGPASPLVITATDATDRKLSGRLAFGRLRLFGSLFDFFAAVVLRLFDDHFAAASAAALATTVAAAAAVMPVTTVMSATATALATTGAFTATRLLFAAAGAFTTARAFTATGAFTAGRFLFAAGSFTTRRLAAMMMMPAAAAVSASTCLRLETDQNDGQRRHSERQPKQISLHQKILQKQGPSLEPSFRSLTRGTLRTGEHASGE